MSVFYSVGQDWCCPKCKRHIILAIGDFNDEERRFPLQHADSRWFVQRLQTIACRQCHRLVSTFGLYRARVDSKGSPELDPTNQSKTLVAETLRSLVVYPLSPLDLNYPKTVLKSIVQDLQEASAIADISPRASAVLARRAVQSVMRDFYKVGKQPTLHAEIVAAQKDMPLSLYEALMAVKTLGNYGAHPERDTDLIVDIEPTEAHQLIEVVRYLIESTYVKQADDEDKLARIKSLAVDKKSHAEKE